METRNFLFTKPLRRCADLRRWLSRYVSLSRLRLLLSLALNHAIRGCHVGVSNINVACNELLTNNRLFVGFVLMFGVAPLFYMAHLFLNPNVVLEGFYYKAPYYWFFTQREEFTVGFFLTGFFLWLPQKWGFRYILVFVVAFCATEIIQQSFFVDSWEDLYVTPSWQYWALAPFAVLAVYKLIDYACYRKYHLRDGNLARIKGVIQSPGLSAKEKSDLLEKLFVEFENYNARI